MFSFLGVAEVDNWLAAVPLYLTEKVLLLPMDAPKKPVVADAVPPTNSVPYLISAYIGRAVVPDRPITLDPGRPQLVPRYARLTLPVGSGCSVTYAERCWLFCGSALLFRLLFKYLVVASPTSPVFRL